MCHSMGAARERVELKIWSDLHLPNAAGQYEQKKTRSVIRVAHAKLNCLMGCCWPFFTPKGLHSTAQGRVAHPGEGRSLYP